MRDLACCAGAIAFYSTPSDLATLRLGQVRPNGEPAGGTVTSLMTLSDSGVVVVVMSSRRLGIASTKPRRGTAPGTGADLAAPDRRTPAAPPTLLN